MSPYKEKMTFTLCCGQKKMGLSLKIGETTCTKQCTKWGRCTVWS